MCLSVFGRCSELEKVFVGDIQGTEKSFARSYNQPLYPPVRALLTAIKALNWYTVSLVPRPIRLIFGDSRSDKGQLCVVFTSWGCIA